MTRFTLLSIGVVLGLGWMVLMLVYFSFLPGWRSLGFLMTVGQVERGLASWSPADIAYHLRGTWTIDLIFPALYGVVLSFVVHRYWQGGRRALLLALVWLSVVADYTDNYFALHLLAGEGGIWPLIIANWIKFIAITWPMDVGLIKWFEEVRLRRKQAV